MDTSKPTKHAAQSRGQTSLSKTVCECPLRPAQSREEEKQTKQEYTKDEEYGGLPGLFDLQDV